MRRGRVTPYWKRARRKRCCALCFERLESRVLLAANVLSYHNEQALGVNSQETQLTPANITTDQFGKRFATLVDGQVYAQPLYVADINITAGSSLGQHRVVYGATEHDSVYAIDADSGAILWRTSFIDPAAGITTMPAKETLAANITDEVGITSTPVIDLANNVLYVHAMTKEVRPGEEHPNHYVQTLHRLSLSDGSYTSTIIADTAYDGVAYYHRVDLDPYTINDRALGSADGAIQIGDEYRVYYNAIRQLVRPGLVINNGNLYLTTASHGDNGPYHGWVLRYDVTGPTPVLNGVLNTTPNGGLGGIWQGGGVPSFDEEGNFYIETGNGTFTPYRVGDQLFGFDAQGFPIDGNYGDSFVKIGVDTEKNSPTNQNINGWGMKVLDYFTPFNEQPLDASDRDLGSVAPLVLPDAVGSAEHPHLLIGSGKEGKLYLIDRDNMGKSDPGFDQSGVYQNAGTDHVVQSIADATTALLNTPAFANVGSINSPDYRIFLVPGYVGHVRAYAIANGAISNAPVSESTDSTYGYLSGSPSISQNGTANSIVWTIERNSHQLRAYNAEDLTQLLYTSGARDQFTGTSQKFSVPTVADGQVFVGTSNALLIYGPPRPPTSPPAAPSDLAAIAAFPTQVQLTWADNSDNEDLFNIERSLDGVTGWTEIGQASANAVSFIDDPVTPNSTYFYRIRAYNSFQNGSYSDFTTIVSTTTSPNPVGLGDGVQATYYDNINFTGTTVSRLDPQVDFDWGFDSPVPGTIDYDEFSVVWTGVVRPEFSESYMFYTTANDGVRLYVAGNLVIDDFINHAAATEDASLAIPLNAGQTYPIRMEMFDLFGDAVAQLRWSSDHTPKALIPQSALYSGTAPAVPSDLTAAPASGTQINLSWVDNSDLETGFKIERKQSPGGTFEQIAIVPPDSIAYMDSALLPNTTYYYRVKAANFGSDSDYSNQAGATTPIPPLTPSDAHPTEVTTTSITFGWTDNSDNEDKFSIFRKTGTGGGFIFLADVPANTTTFADAGRQPGTYYDYHIQAANLGGYTDFAGFAITTITNPPYDVTAAAEQRQIVLDWTPSLGADSYNVYRGTSPGDQDATPIATGIVGNEYVDTLIDDGVSYYYTLTAVTTGGESAFSSEVQVDSLSNIVIPGTDGDDLIYAITTADKFDIYVNIPPVGEPSYRLPLANIGMVTFNTVEGDDSLTVDGSNGPGFGQVIYNAGSGSNTLTLSAGSARIDSTSAGGTLDTTVGAGAQLSTRRLVQNGLSLEDDSQVVLLLDGGTSRVTSLSLGTGATLDVTDNALVIDYTESSPVTTIRDAILSGRGGSGTGNGWTEAGITSSTAAQANQSVPESRSVGYAENALLPLGAYSSFRELAVDGTSVLIAYTRTGDANLDGVVDNNDVTILGANYAPGVSKPAWALGDFDYNGFVDNDDVTLLGAFYNPAPAPAPVPEQATADGVSGGMVSGELLSAASLSDVRGQETRAQQQETRVQQQTRAEQAEAGADDKDIDSEGLLNLLAEAVLSLQKWPSAGRTPIVHGAKTASRIWTDSAWFTGR